MEELKKIAAGFDSLPNFLRAAELAFLEQKGGEATKDKLTVRALRKTKWTVEELRQEALKYNSRTQFQGCYPGAYKTAERLKILDDICAHMKPGLFYTKEKVKELLEEYPENYQLYCHSQAAYKAAINFGLITTRAKRKKITFEDVQEEVKKYDNLADFREQSQSYYKSAWRNGWSELFSHLRKNAHRKK